MLKINLYSTVLFDLDGTIIDSAEGIFNCLEYSLQHFGIKQPREAFYKCLGPSLRTSFLDFLPENKVEQAIQLYRERYSETGLYECSVYQGVEQMLKELKKNGFRIALATSKPEPYAKTILKHLKLDVYFNFIGGAEFTASRDTKAAVISYVMQEMKCLHNEAIMVGDRFYDMQGAAQCGIASAGVLYGYGTSSELCDGYSPVILANTAHELCNWLLKQGKVN